MSRVLECVCLGEGGSEGGGGGGLRRRSAATGRVKIQHTELLLLLIAFVKRYSLL